MLHPLTMSSCPIPGPGGHVSKYNLSWLADNSYEKKHAESVQPRVLWNSDIYKKANVPAAKWETFMSSDEEVKKFLQSYILYGIAFVDGVPATVEATEAVTQRVSLIRYEATATPSYDFSTNVMSIKVSALLCFVSV